MAAAARKAQEASSDEQISLEAERRLSRLAELCKEIDHHSRHLEGAYTDMLDSLAARMMRLSEIARTADFSPPEWPVGAEHNVEIKLSETRELTLRLSRNRRRQNDAGQRSSGHTHPPR